MKIIKPKKVIISRTDSIGDVVLTLPVAGALKQLYPDVNIIFLGRNYTFPILKACENIDEMISWDELEGLPLKDLVKIIKSTGADTFIHVFPNKEIANLAWRAGVKHRIGTGRRLYNFFTCNLKLNLKRRSSNLHESQLNLKLLTPLGSKELYALEEIPEMYGLSKIPALQPEFKKLIKENKQNIVIHPRSKGSAKEWGLENFGRLVNALDPERYHVFVTGTEEEGKQVRAHLPLGEKHISDMTGKMSLDQLMAFINNCDALVAASTGPLHIASALGKKAIGIFSPKRPIHPGRWMPIGKSATALVFDENCELCNQGKNCNCITQITTNQVVNALESLS